MNVRQEMMFDDRSYGGWAWPVRDARVQIVADGALLCTGAEETLTIEGEGVHTWNGDAIELVFRVEGALTGTLEFGFRGGHERAMATLDLAASTLDLRTTDWTVPQPVASASISGDFAEKHSLKLVKREGAGHLVKMANIEVYWDGQCVLTARDQHLLPEMGVRLALKHQSVLARRFALYGDPPGLPEFFHVGGYQMLNKPSLEENLAAIGRGLRQAAELGVQLLVTPETSLTGLHPRAAVTQHLGPIAEAEEKLRSVMKGIPGCPYLIAGLPVWRAHSSQPGRTIRYNVSRLYEPDGRIAADFPKIHSCEDDFWHGYRLNEFDVCGVPITLHVCHDQRYPEVWTLPVMFGARLIVHPANIGPSRAAPSVDAFEKIAKQTVETSNAFYLHVGSRESYLVSPQKFNIIIDASLESRRDNPSFPMVGTPKECLLHGVIRVHDAYGWYPTRSFRASEEIARAYVALYQALGGTRPVPGE